MYPLAPYFLQIFGPHYVEQGTWTLRVLSFATVAAAFNYWGAIRLRLASHLPAMIARAGAEHGRDARSRRDARLPRDGLGRGRVGHRAPGRWRRRLRSRASPSPASATPCRTPTSCPRLSRPHEPAEPRRHHRPPAAPRHADRALAGRPAVAVGGGLGVPGDRGQRARGGPRPAGAVRRPRGLAPRVRDPLPPRCCALADARAMVLVPKASLARAGRPTCAPRSCSSPTASTAARVRPRASRSSTSGTATAPRTSGPRTVSAG